jgi:hypothetical protein
MMDEVEPPMDINITEVALELRPVFIVGFPRTGTTLLYRLLYRHGTFYPGIQVEMEGYNAIVETRYVHRFFNHAVDLWSSADDNSLKRWFAYDWEAYTSFLLDCFRSFHVQAAAARKCRRILEKTPGHILICEFMLQAFPYAQMLCLRRDPADTLASFRRRRSIQVGADGKWLDLSYHLDSFVERWNQRATAWNEFVAAHPACGLVVDYSQLTTRPEVVVPQVLHFLAEDMEPRILAGSIPLETPNQVNRYNSHIPRSNNEVWRTYVGEDEAARVRAECISIDDSAVASSMAKQ